MKKILNCTFLLIVLCSHTFLFALGTMDGNEIETIVFMRHGEKYLAPEGQPPHDDVGQITCEGLNRALKLPQVLISKFGKANYIFASNPSKDVEKKFGKNNSYVRPLATIEPTAVQLNLPVNALYSWQDVSGISKELLNYRYKNSLVFVAWEHKKLVKIARSIYTKLGGKEDDIPQWKKNDFDSLYIIKITSNSKGSRSATFLQNSQGLNGQSTECPHS